LEQLWDIAAAPPRLLSSEDQMRLEFSPDGKWLRGWRSTVGPYETSMVFDAATFTRQRVPAETIELTFAPDNRTIAARAQVTSSSLQQWLERFLPGPSRPPSYEAVQVWTFPDWKEIAAFPRGRCFAFFPDGRSLAVGHEDGRIEIWDLPPKRAWWIE